LGEKHEIQIVKLMCNTSLAVKCIDKSRAMHMCKFTTIEWFRYEMVFDKGGFKLSLAFTVICPFISSISISLPLSLLSIFWKKYYDTSNSLNKARTKIWKITMTSS